MTEIPSAGNLSKNLEVVLFGRQLAPNSNDKGRSSVTQLVGTDVVKFITAKQGLKWQWSPGATLVKHWETWLFSVNPGLAEIK